MSKLPILILCFLTNSFFARAQNNPTMRYEDKIRIREAIIISEQIGNNIWKGINEVPFVVLLVTDSIEFLINHPYPSNDFILSENDTILNTNILYRQRQFPDYFLATFPAVNGVNCIVVGTPEKTNKSSTEWTITLLHEHFHQYQFTQPDYYSSIDKLELSGGDQTGMWQLNYSFPYENAEVIEQYNKYTSALLKAVLTIERKNFQKEFKKYLVQRNKFQSYLKPADYRYFSFQVWQEGIARHTEYEFLNELNHYTPTVEITRLSDYLSFQEVRDKFYLSELNALKNLKLDIERRVCFYAIGFAEGILLNKQNANWKDKYFEEKFYIENYYKK